TFQIGELAKRTALSIDAIRFYERRKLLPPAPRSAGRFRLYTPDAIERLRFVRRMQGLGFSLQEIKELMGGRADRAHACSAVRQQEVRRELALVGYHGARVNGARIEPWARNAKAFGLSCRTCHDGSPPSGAPTRKLHSRAISESMTDGAVRLATEPIVSTAGA